MGAMEKPKLVRDVMTQKVITLFEEDNLVGVEKGMKHFKFRHLPVVDAGKLVGLVTHRDLLRVAASTMESGGAQKTAHLNENVFVRDVMQRDVKTVTPDMTLLAAGQMMWEGKIGCLPVVDASQQLVGIITEADFLKLALTLLETS
jgi:CBS domain-containing membrane protein